MTNDITTIVANLALTLSLIVAVIFGIAQVRAAARDRTERLTLEALRNFQSREFVEIMNYVVMNDMPKTREEWEALPKEDQVSYTQFAQQMESLGMLVAERLINIDLVDKTIGSLVSTAWDKYKPMISDSRIKLPDPFLCEYFQWLAEEMDKRMKENPRKPFFETNIHAASLAK